jgi:hypothetical protein
LLPLVVASEITAHSCNSTCRESPLQHSMLCCRQHYCRVLRCKGFGSRAPLQSDSLQRALKQSVICTRNSAEGALQQRVLCDRGYSSTEGALGQRVLFDRVCSATKVLCAESRLPQRVLCTRECLQPTVTGQVARSTRRQTTYGPDTNQYL